MDRRDARRHLSAPRLTVLMILAETGAADQDAIYGEWLRMRPDLSERHIRELPRMIRNLLWRLEILEWIRPVESGYELTDLGAGIVASASPPAPR